MSVAIASGWCLDEAGRLRRETILGDEAAIAKALAYLADNPRRLWAKRAHPELFKVLRDLSCSTIVYEAAG